MKVAFPCIGTATLALNHFFYDLGIEVVVPPLPTRRTLELGVRYSPEQICLPFKITLGSMLESLERGADTFFMAAGTRKCRFGYYHLIQERLLAEASPGTRMFGLSQYSAFDFIFRRVPGILSVSPALVARAVLLLLARSALCHDFDQLLRRWRVVDFGAAERFARAGPEMLARARTPSDIRRARQELRRLSRAVQPDPETLKIGIVGEVYLMIEPLANAEIEKELGRLGVEVRVERSLYRHLRHLLNTDLDYLTTARCARRYIGESPGGEVTKTVGEAVRFARQGLDGVIHVFPFTCMPENMALEILQQVSEDYRLPVMSLSFDEHTSKTGLITRLEAFVDMVARRKSQGRRAACA